MVWIKSNIKQEGDFEGEFWNGEYIIEGKVEDVKIGAYNKYFMKIRTKEGKLYITPQHHDLSMQIQALKIVKNDIVRLEYLGEIEVGQINTMKHYLLEKWEEN